MIGPYHGAEVMLALGPPWAERIAAEIPDLGEVQRLLWHHAAVTVSRWPSAHRQAAEANRRVDDAGMVHLVERPEDLLLIVCGGLSNLHGLALHTFGPTKAVTRGFGLPSPTGG
jgi:hypothetical protein